MIMPLTSMMPMLLRAPAPGPVAMTSGKCPATVAAVVIRIGRSRVAAASMTAASLSMPGLLQVIGELHDQDAVLGHQADERDQPHLAVDVQRRQPEEREEQRARDRERHRTRQDDEGIAEALELRRQDQIDQDRRQQKRRQELAALGAQLARLARVVDREALRQDRPGLRFQEGQRLIERHRRGNDTLDAHGVELLEFLQLPRLGVVCRLAKVDSGTSLSSEPVMCMCDS